MNKDPINDFRKYREFLKSIPLEKYRKELKDIKWVEQDLYREMLPLASIFKYYWEERKFLSFDKWFKVFWKELNTNPTSKKALVKFKKYYFDKSENENDWFKKGLKARMYRTWISILTQLDFCYAFEYVCVKDKKIEDFKIECNAELDAKGIDFKINNIGFQVFKISQRKEARPSGKRKAVITIPYAVYNVEELRRKCRSSRVKDKSGYEKALNAFNKYFFRLDNGFIVFKEEYIKLITEKMNNIEEVRGIVNKILKELSGEI